jgi:hypothetical protein
MEIRIITCSEEQFDNEPQATLNSAEPNITKPNCGVGEISSPFRRKNRSTDKFNLSFNQPSTTVDSPVSEIQ